MTLLDRKWSRLSFGNVRISRTLPKCDRHSVTSLSATMVAQTLFGKTDYMPIAIYRSVVVRLRSSLACPVGTGSGRRRGGTERSDSDHTEWTASGRVRSRECTVWLITVNNMTFIGSKNEVQAIAMLIYILIFRNPRCSDVNVSSLYRTKRQANIHREMPKWYI